MPTLKNPASIAFLFTFVLILGMPAHPLLAQGQLPATVRLPIFKNFYYQGAVRVPDGGTMSLGGVTSSASGSAKYGVPGLSGVPGVGRAFSNRGIGTSQSSDSAQVKADILILEELEAAHLNQAGYPEGRLTESEIVKKAAFLTKHMGRNPRFRPEDGR